MTVVESGFSENADRRKGAEEERARIIRWLEQYAAESSDTTMGRGVKMIVESLARSIALRAHLK